MSLLTIEEMLIAHRVFIHNFCGSAFPEETDVIFSDLEGSDIVVLLDKNQKILFGFECMIAFYDKKAELCIKPITENGIEGTLTDYIRCSTRTVPEIFLELLNWVYKRK